MLKCRRSRLQKEHVSSGSTFETKEVWSCLRRYIFSSSHSWGISNSSWGSKYFSQVTDISILSQTPNILILILKIHWMILHWNYQEVHDCFWEIHFLKQLHQVSFSARDPPSFLVYKPTFSFSAYFLVV